MNKELVEEWWDELRNPITGWRLKSSPTKKQQHEWSRKRREKRLANKL